MQNTLWNRELCKGLDSVAFAVEELNFYPFPDQARLLRSKRKRILLNCHRQWGKSEITAIKALHNALYKPGFFTIILSPTLRQSSELFRKITEWSFMVKNLPEKVEDSKLFTTLANRSRIVSLPAREGTIRGYSDPDLIIVDEAARVEEGEYTAMWPMATSSNATVMLLSTPYGKRGTFYHEWTKGGDDWERFHITEKETYKFSKEELVSQRRLLGERGYAQEFKCEFVETEGQVIAQRYIDAMFEGEKPTSLFGDMLSSDVERFDG